MTSAQEMQAALSVATGASPKPGAILGPPNGVLPDGRKLGPSGRLLKGQPVPSAVSAKPSAKPDAPRAATPDDVRGERMLSEAEARTVCEALAIAAEVLGNFASAADDALEEPDPTAALVAGLVSQKADRFADLLDRLMLEPVKPVAPVVAPVAPPKARDARWDALRSGPPALPVALHGAPGHGRSLAGPRGRLP